MPEHLRALLVILVLATAVFMAAKRPVCNAGLMRQESFVWRRNWWFALTLAAFLSHSFWVFMVISAAMLGLATARERNKPAFFFFVLFAVPMITEHITGFGVIQQLFAINQVRLLALVVLLPAYLVLRGKPDTIRFGQTTPDKLLAAYLLLNLALQLTVDTYTNTLRFGFYAFVDVFLPYYVVSRSLKRRDDFNDAAMALVLASLLLVPVAVFEFAKGWLLYTQLEDALQAASGWNSYLRRGESLRAMGSSEHPIVLGYVFVVGMGLFLAFTRSFASRAISVWVLLAFAAGLVATVSRGPWAGAVVLMVVFVLTGPKPWHGLAVLGGAVLMLAAGFALTPIGQSLIDYLPFVGNVGSETITYRQLLLENSIQVIQRNPVFGSFDFFYTPEMQALKQGQGIIDLVNSYVGIALRSGLVGLSLFISFFLVIAVGVLRSARLEDGQAENTQCIGRALFATLMAVLVVIFTVSSVGVIPVLYWSLAGMGLAYVNAVRDLGISRTHVMGSSPSGWLPDEAKA